MKTTRRLPIVGVMGSGTDPCLPRAVELGRLLARLPVNLLTGGGGGVMESVSRAYSEVSERLGTIVGILPCDGADPACLPRSGYPNPFVEIVIQTHLPLSGEHGADPLSRNHINVLSSDAIVVLPGGAGTESEARLALRYGRPCFGFLDEGEMPGLRKMERSASIDEVERFVLRHVAGDQGR